MAGGGRVLWWDGEQGLVVHDQVHAKLPRAPRIPGIAIELIDYAPGVGQLWVREPGQAWRTLTPAEKVEVDAALGRMVNAMLQEIC